MLEADYTHKFDWLPGAEFAGEAKLHIWGTPRVGHASVGEQDFIEGGPQVAVTEVTVDLFGSLIPLALSHCDEATRQRMERHFFEVVGGEKLAELLWDSRERNHSCSYRTWDLNQSNVAATADTTDRDQEQASRVTGSVLVRMLGRVGLGIERLRRLFWSRNPS